MISNIYVRNFKSLNDIDFVLTNLTLIAGKNNVGKSSLIQVLLLLRQSYEKTTLLESGLLLQGDYIKVGNGKDALSNDTNEDFFQFTIDWEDNFCLNLKYEYKSKSDLQPFLLKKCDEYSRTSLFEKALFNNNFRYLSANRITPQSSYPASDYHVSTLNSLGITGEYTPHYLAVNENLEVTDMLCHDQSSPKTLLNQVNAWMSEMSGGIKIGANVIEERNDVSLTYQFLTEGGRTDKFTPVNVGFGLTYVLPVVTVLLSAKVGDLLIIENPEAHLHPSGQSTMGKLISLVAESGVQIIVETHSDHLLNGVRVAVGEKKISKDNISLLYFSKDEELKQHATITTPYLDEKGRLDEWPQGFFDEWKIQLDKLLDA
jgi:predicted ATPase